MFALQCRKSVRPPMADARTTQKQRRRKRTTLYVIGSGSWNDSRYGRTSSGLDCISSFTFFLLDSLSSGEVNCRTVGTRCDPGVASDWRKWNGRRSVRLGNHSVSFFTSSEAFSFVIRKGSSKALLTTGLTLTFRYCDFCSVQ